MLWNQYLFLTKAHFVSLLCFSIFCSSVVFVNGQSATYSGIRGYVKSELTNEILIGATVTIKGSPIYAITNDYGYFVLKKELIAVDTLVINYLGYQTKEVPISGTGKSNFVEILLVEDNLIEDVIIISEINHFKKSQYKTLSQFEIVPSVIQKDFLRSIHILPSVQTGNEGQVAFQVRGGNSDHNLILLDNAPIFRPSHGLGFFSAISGDAVSSFQFFKDNFPVEFGGRSASVMNLKMKEGRTDSLKYTANIGILSSDLQISGPIVKDRTSFLLGVRRSYIDLLSKTFLLTQSNKGIDPSVNFFDLNINFSHQMNPSNKIVYNGYHSRDFFRLSLGESSSANKNGHTTWSNRVHSINWNSVISKSFFLTSTFYVSSYFSKIRDIQNIGEDELFNEFRYENQAENIGLKSVLEYAVNSQNYFKSGFELVRHHYVPLNSSFIDNTTNETIDVVTSDSRFVELSVFAGHKIEFGNNDLNLGVRYSYLSHINYSSLQPRITYQVTFKGFDFNISYDRMIQIANTVSSSKLSLPTDVVVPATNSFPPLESDQFSLGAFKKFRNLKISINPFYKFLNGVLNYKEGFSFIDPNSFDIKVTSGWEENITRGQGTVFGADFTAEGYVFQTSYLLMSYTYTDAKRQFLDLNQGSPFPFRFNRKHVFDLVVSHKFSERSEISVAWNFGSGQYTSFPQFLIPLTYTEPPISFEGATGQFIAIYDFGDRNSVKLPAYHRLDIG